MPLPPSDASGDIRLDTTWTAFPPGIELYSQVWQIAPFDVRASPGLVVESR